MNVPVEELTALQQETTCIRNLCIIAHVDHGKTTLSDHLIASNGLIHPRLAGGLRFLDSKEDEVVRGITMKSSSISLLHRQAGTRYLANLIDSPGHVDFCSEVSTAVRLSDGALCVVDAVEGVASQTHAVLRQAWQEKVKLVLVVNKVDRLISELRLSPAEAYLRLQHIIAHANMILSSFASEQFLSEADALLAHEDARAAGEEAGGEAQGRAHDAGEEEEQEAEFSPAKGNVAFASALDGWAFRTSQFAALYAAKLGCSAHALERALWGDWALQPKSRRIVRLKGADARLKPLFVQLALEPIWKAYGVLDLGAPHAPALAKMAAGLGLTGLDKALSHPDARAALRSLMRAWLPLSAAVLGMAVDCLPNPREAAPERVSRLLPPPLPAQEAAMTDDMRVGTDAQREAVQACSGDEDAPLTVFVSKMVAVPVAAMPRQAGEAAPLDPNEERFLGFGRVFSGRLKPGATLQVLTALYNPAEPHAQRQEVRVSNLYLMMGRGLEQLQEVPVGNVVAIAGLDTAVLKSATLTASPSAWPLAPMRFQTSALVRVAVEPALPDELPRLRAGLALLNRADPFVEVEVTPTGEHVIAAAGEVHLETCLKDLQERFARCALTVSPPLVAFRESVACAAEAPPEAQAGKTARVVEVTTANGLCVLRVRALPLPAPVASALDRSQALLRATLDVRTQAAAAQLPPALDGGSDEDGRPESGAAAAAAAAEAVTASGSGQQADLSALRERLLALAEDSGGKRCAALLRRAWALGPSHCGPNLLLAPAAGGDRAGGGLFGAPPQQVVALSKVAAVWRRGVAVGEAAAAPVPGGEVGAVVGGGDGGKAADAQLQWVDVAVGAPHASIQLQLARTQAQDQAQGQANGGANGAYAATANGSAAGCGRAADGAGQTLDTQAQRLRQSVEAGVSGGFQIAASAGPLCDEPLWGVAFEVEARLLLPDGGGAVALGEDVYGPFVGQVTSSVRAAMRAAVLEAGPRLVEAMHLAECSTSAEALSGVYAALGRRRARILREQLREGSDTFIVHSYLPAQASFGFAEELRRRCSGQAAASLMLSHWERLQEDPFFVPWTEEQKEEWGEEGPAAHNLARQLMDAVRRRKGLPVEEKVVESATKQRTRARKV